MPPLPAFAHLARFATTHALPCTALLYSVVLLLLLLLLLPPPPPLLWSLLLQLLLVACLPQQMVQYGVFIFFGAFQFLALLYCIFLQPETRGVPIEEAANVVRAHWFWRRVAYPGKAQLQGRTRHCISTQLWASRQVC